MTTFLHIYKVIIMYGEIKNMDKLTLQQIPRYKSKKKLKKHKKILIMTNFLHRYKVIIMYSKTINMGRLTLHLVRKTPFHDTEIKHNNDIIMNEEEPKMCKLRDKYQNRLKIGITFKSQYMKNRYKNGGLSLNTSRQLLSVLKVKNPLKNCFMLLIKHIKEVVYMYGEVIKMVKLMLKSMHIMLETISKNIGGD